MWSVNAIAPPLALCPPFGSPLPCRATRARLLTHVYTSTGCRICSSNLCPLCVSTRYIFLYMINVIFTGLLASVWVCAFHLVQLVGLPQYPRMQRGYDVTFRVVWELFLSYKICLCPLFASSSIRSLFLNHYTCAVCPSSSVSLFVSVLDRPHCSPIAHSWNKCTTGLPKKVYPAPWGKKTYYIHTVHEMFYLMCVFIRQSTCASRRWQNKFCKYFLKRHVSISSIFGYQ